MLLALLIFLILVIIQVAVAAYALLISRNIDQRYDIPLGSQTEAAITLENYVKIYREIGVRVDADISFPAYAFEDYIFVNKDQMYNFDLFTNFFILFQLELTKKEHNFVRKMHIFQNFLFFASIIAVIAGTLLGTELLGTYVIYIAIGIQGFLFLFSCGGYIIYNKVLNNSLDVAYDLLDLDDVELAQADQLKNDLRMHVFEYPLLVLGRILRFFLPF